MPRAAAWMSLSLGLLAVSTAGPFLVMAHVDAYALVLFRLACAGLLLLGWSAARGELASARPHLRRLAWGALLLAAHFALWVKAFDLTDYASNLLLLVAQPAMAAVVGFWIGERPGRDVWISLALAASGLAIIAGGDLRLGPAALLGDLLCILAGLAITLFIPVTRRSRAEMPLTAFLGIVFTFGAVLVAPVVLLAGDRVVDYPPASWAWVAALVLVPTILGHGLMNHAARHVKLFTLNLVIVLEPAIGIALGAFLFGATVTPLQLGGGVLLAAAVVVGLRQERAPRQAPAAGVAAS